MTKFTPQTRQVTVICLALLTGFFYYKGLNEPGFAVLGALLMFIKADGND